MAKTFAKEAPILKAMPGSEHKVSCLGPEGSFSELAARKMRSGFEIALKGSFTAAVAALTSGETDYAVLPVENSINGGVYRALDLMTEENVFGIEEYALPVDLRLATLAGVRYEDVDTVYTHEQAFGQCNEFLSRTFPGARRLYTVSTAESLARLDGHSAGIVGAHIEREGIAVSDENIADYKQNFTRFLLLRRGGELPVSSSMVFVSAVCPHTPGALLGLLKIFRRYGLNLTRTESRPMPEAFGQYRFFIEFAGNIAADWVKSALREANAYCIRFKLLGAYN